MDLYEYCCENMLLFCPKIKCRHHALCYNVTLLPKVREKNFAKFRGKPYRSPYYPAGPPLALHNVRVNIGATAMLKIGSILPRIPDCHWVFGGVGTPLYPPPSPHTLPSIPSKTAPQHLYPRISASHFTPINNYSLFLCDLHSGKARVRPVSMPHRDTIDDFGLRLQNHCTLN